MNFKCALKMLRLVLVLLGGFTGLLQAGVEDFTVESPVDNRKFTLSQARGRFVVLHFLLKTECPFCQKHTRAHMKSAAAQSDVVHVFLKPDSADDIRHWAEATTAGTSTGPLTIYRDPEAALAKRFQIPAGYQFHGESMHYPALVLLDGSGKEVFRHVGKDNTDRFSVAQLEAKLGELRQRATAPAAAEPDRIEKELAALRAEVEVLKSKATDQAHVMHSVAYHFGNLWFAAQKQNWPLAEFYWGETRSHLRWAVRVIPVRKDPQGNPVRLEEILGSIEKTTFEELHKTIQGKNLGGFSDGYRQMLESCTACHVAAGKPYLKLRVPDRPPEPLMQFEPQP